MAGVDDVTPHIEIEGADKATDDLNKIGDAGEQAFNRVSEAATKSGLSMGTLESIAKRTKETVAEVDERFAKGFSDPWAKVVDNTKKAESAFKDIGAVAAEAFGKIIDAASSGNLAPLMTLLFGKMAGAITEVIQKTSEFVAAQATLVETLSNLAEATGASLSQIEALKDAFASVGISANGFERAMGRLAITVANEWVQIQHIVRTSADQQTSAMLNMQSAALGVEKAHHALNFAMSESAKTAARNGLAVQAASLSMKRAAQELADFALQSQHNTNSVAGAELALERANQNLRKDRGGVSKEEEQRLKFAQDTLAVKEAELNLQDAQNKKSKETLELEELVLKVKKSRQDSADADAKRIEDSVKATEHLKDASLAVQKANLARSEAAEKMHEADLKNIPAIAKEVESVSEGHKKWDEVINHTEISAQNLTKAIILAASGGDVSKQPTALSVFEKMIEIFPKITDEGQKLAIVQQTMGAGFRSGQASAAQIIAVLNRFGDDTGKAKEALKGLFEETEKFSHVKLGGLDLSGSTESLKSFNAASAQMEAALEQVKNRMAGILAVPLNDFFTKIKESIYDTDGVLRRLADGAGEILKKISDAFQGLVATLSDSTVLKRFIDLLGQVFTAIGDLIGIILKLVGVWKDLTGADPARIFKTLAVAIDIATIAVIGLRAGLASLLIILGAVQAGYDRVFGSAKDFNEAFKNSPIFQAGKAQLAEAQKDFSKATKNLGEDVFGKDEKDTSAKTLDKAANKHDQAATKLDAAGNKIETVAGVQGTAADKHGAAADKHGSAADKLQEASSQVATKMGGAADKLSVAAAALQTAAIALQSVASAGGAKATPKAGGGKIQGPGGPSDDKAGLFALSDGEYVVRTAAVQHYGAPLFEALNNLSLGGFAAGGMVGPRVGTPSAPSGGAQNILNLTIDGQQFNGLKAPEHVAAKLKTYAVGRQSSSAGRMPTWMR